MAGKNGRIKEIYIDKELKKHIYNEFYWFSAGECVTDYMYERWGIILFEYDTLEEMMEAVDTINERARVVMENDVKYN